MKTVNDIKLIFLSFTRISIIDASSDKTIYIGDLMNVPRELISRRVWYCDIEPDRSITIMLMPE